LDGRNPQALAYGNIVELKLGELIANTPCVQSLIPVGRGSSGTWTHRVVLRKPVDEPQSLGMHEILEDFESRCHAGSY
jgi:hypothetical protein